MACFVYMTAKDREEATSLGRTLVEERLAACVNVLDGMTSLYWWEGKVQEDNEAVLIAKTADEKTEALIERAKALHSYDCPCIVALPVSAGNEAFLEWIEQETRSR